MWVLTNGVSVRSIAATSEAIDLWLNCAQSPNSDDVARLKKGLLPIALRLNPDVWGDLASSPPILDYVSSELRCEVTEIAVLYPPAIRLRTGSAMSKVPPHRDSDYTGRPKEFVTAWIPLRGPKHLLGLDFWNPKGNSSDSTSVDSETPQGGLDGKVWRRAVDVLDGTCLPVRCAVTDAILFREWEVHSTPDHDSQSSRLSVDFRYFRFSDTSDVPLWLPLSRQLCNSY
jgi:hypothetical protein